MSYPTKILSAKNLKIAWNDSKDSTSNYGAPGIDDQSAKNFANNLDTNIIRIANAIATGQYHFTKLRPSAYPKGNSGKERLICIPTVRDRLVQRCIASYLEESQKLPIYNKVSFGFIKGAGMECALKRALKLREDYPFVFETDITKFFDNISREDLKQKLKAKLPRSNLLPLLNNLIDIEAKERPSCNHKKMHSLGVTVGKGLRQGMPLSPVLANLVLADFDKRIISQKIPMVRYADDFVTFAKTKNEAHQHEKLIRAELKKIGLAIPELIEDGKTKITGNNQPFEFLGIEIYYCNADGRYKKRLSEKKISSILNNTHEQFNFPQAIKNGWDFNTFNLKLSRRIGSYKGTYEKLENYKNLENKLHRDGKKILLNVYKEIFGKDIETNLTQNKLKFLGIDVFQEDNTNQEPV